MPINYLQQVITYSKSNLALLLNNSPFISTSNTDYKEFNDSMPKNLGDTVSFDKPPRFTTRKSLIAEFQPATQLVQTLTVDRPVSSSYQFSSQQFIFNVRDYIDKFGRSAMAEIGAEVESDMASLAETNTFRFYGAANNPITTAAQLTKALAFFRNFGAATVGTKGYVTDMAVPDIVNSNLNQFVNNRNQEQSLSWQLAEFADCKWYQSNLLPIHYSGNQAEDGVPLTVKSVVKNSEGGVIQITFTGASIASDTNCVKKYDKFMFSDGIANLPNLRFKTYIGHKNSACPVQFRATENAQSNNNSEVTVDIFPALQATAGQNQNITHEILEGMQVTILPSHRCGLIFSGGAMYLAMPRLPDTPPFPCSVVQDPETKVSIRQYYGELFGLDSRGMINDCIYGKTLVDEYALMLVFPV